MPRINQWYTAGGEKIALLIYRALGQGAYFCVFGKKELFPSIYHQQPLIIRAFYGVTRVETKEKYEKYNLLSFGMGTSQVNFMHDGFLVASGNGGIQKWRAAKT